MNNLEECLASTGSDVYLPVVLSSLIIVTAAVVIWRSGYSKTSFFSLVIVSVLGISMVASDSAPVYAADDCRTGAEVAQATAVPDRSSGVRGQLQSFKVLDNDTPSEGASFVFSSLKLATVSDPLPGTTVDAGASRVIAPAEGTYEARPQGVIEFLPDSGFLGQARGVRYSIEDTSGVVVASTYTPFVSDESCQESDSIEFYDRVYDDWSNGDAPWSVKRIHLSLLQDEFTQYPIETTPEISIGHAVNGERYEYNTASLQWDRAGAFSNKDMRIFDVSRDGRTKLGASRNEESGVYAVYVSMDGGLTWAGVPAHNPTDMTGYIGYGSVSEDGQVIALRSSSDNNDVVRYTNNGGASWSTIVVPTGGADGSVDHVKLSDDGTTLIAPAYSGYYSGGESSVRVSVDGGVSWRTSGPMGTGTDSLGVSTDGQTILVGTAGSLITSTDGGLSWNSHSPVGITGDYVNYSYVDSSGAQMYVISNDYDTGNAQAYHSSDGGATWVPYSLPGTIIEGRTIYGSGNSAIIIAHTPDYEQVILRTIDNGVTWSEINMYLDQDFATSEVDIDPGTPGVQQVLDLSETHGMVVSYDPVQDLLTVEDVRGEMEDTENLQKLYSVQYTINRPGACQPEPRDILFVQSGET